MNLLRGNRYLALFLASALTLLAQQPTVPRKAPDYAFQTAPEKYVWLSEYSGKTRIVAFILTGCVHCQFTTGVLNRIQKEYASRNVQVIASAIEPMSSLNIPDFQKKFSPAFPVGYNEQSYAAKFLGLPPNDPMMMPQLAFIDRNGVIRTQFSGDAPAMSKDIQEKSLRDALEKTIKEGQATLGSPARK
ncbi:MAG TPA: TlpA disulfide reductase family protein [Bryobacteraceae bacterium]|nr:TlpA disulfide reductase family protein [Bryobacteraceae bacterium]